MAYWTFSDVFEEGGVVKTPFYGGFGLLAAGGIPKPSFNAFALLHQLGERRFSPEINEALLTRKPNGTVVVALWNYREVGDPRTESRRVSLEFQNVASRTAQVRLLDGTHGNVAAAYARMGSPRYPTRQQLQDLRRAAALPAAVSHPLGDRGCLALESPPVGLVLVTIKAQPK